MRGAMLIVTMVAMLIVGLLYKKHAAAETATLARALHTKPGDASPQSVHAATKALEDELKHNAQKQAQDMERTVKSLDN